MQAKNPPVFLYKLFAIAFALIILYLAVIPIPEPPVDVPLSDKIAHFGAFYVLGVMAALPFLRGKRQFLWAFVFPAIYGVAIELIQSRIPSRNADIWDFVANTLGALSAYVTVVIYIKIKRNKYDS
jgi:VanZ family protein